MSNEQQPAAVPQTGAPAQSQPTATPTSAAVQLKSSLKGMGYADGANFLQPGGGRGPLQKKVQQQAGAVVQMLPGDTVPAAADMERERPVGGAVAEDIRTRIMDSVRRSPHMVDVLRAIEQNGGAAFAMKWSNRGTYHQGGEIFIDRSWQIGFWVVSLCHELSHLLDFRRGQAPNIMTLPRDAYVRIQVEQEIRAHAINYAAHRQLEGQRAAMGTALAGEPTGWAAFRIHLQGLETAAGRSFTSAQVQAAAEAWLPQQYRTNPAFFTSDTHENYYTYHGRFWDAAHPGGR